MLYVSILCNAVPKSRFKIKKESSKNSYERCDHESVDDGSISILGQILKRDKKEFMHLRVKSCTHELKYAFRVIATQKRSN